VKLLDPGVSWAEGVKCNWNFIDSPLDVVQNTEGFLFVYWALEGWNSFNIVGVEDFQGFRFDCFRFVEFWEVLNSIC
jgi:hypothetical protein